jgi:molybdopterin-guanine dinucleotide biosynthesis protein A
VILKNEKLMPPLCGLILAGGKSSRMGHDKSSLVYHDKDQAHHSYSLLEQICQKVFVSCRSDQGDLAHLKDLPKIYDTYSDIGPIGGILSAQAKHTNTPFLVIACDLPFVDLAFLNYLVRMRDAEKVATAYINPETTWLEPLCTIYEPKSQVNFLEALNNGIRCPRKVIMNSDVKSILMEGKNSIVNANFPEDYQKIKSNLGERCSLK